MVNYWLVITADFENVAELQPQGGCDDPSFYYLFKLKCGSCGELTEKETCVALERSAQIPGSKRTANLVQKCKFCEREGTVSLVTGKGKPLTQGLSEARKYTGLMMFDCRGYEPVGFLFQGGWTVETVAGTTFEDVDLSDGEFVEYDEKGKCSVMISNLKSRFVVAKWK